jgi:hypothetical protein
LPLYVPSSLSMTLHWLLYSVMKLYWHIPLANPGVHVHRYACTDTDTLVAEDAFVESIHEALF